MKAQDRGSRPVLQSFLEAVGDRVTPSTVSKATLVELCHGLEDLLVAEDLAGTVVAGFQQVRFWAVERERYETMTADPRRRAVVFTGDDDGVATSVQHLVVGTDDPIAREWFLLTLNEAFSAVLFGRELARSGEAVGGQRLFLTAWSFDPTVVNQLHSVLRETVGDVPGAVSALAAARAAHPPRHAAPGMTQGFTNMLVERLEATSQRWLAAEAELRALGRCPTADRVAPVADDEPDGRGLRTDELVAMGAGEQAGNGAAATVLGVPSISPTYLGETGRLPRPAGRALVLDADPAMRGLLEALLRRAGWKVTAAASLRDAAGSLRQTTVDVVLVDLLLAGDDARTPLTELERIQPGVRELTAFMADDPPAGRALIGRPVISRPVVWSELEHVLGTLTAAL